MRIEFQSDDDSWALDCEAVLFDLDGTLVDSKTCVEGTWRAWAARHGLNGDDVIAIAHGRQNFDAMETIDPKLNTAEERAWMKRAEENCREGIQAIPGAAGVVNALPDEAWAIVTSCWKKLARIRLSVAGLPEPSVLYSADDVPRSKPDPQGFLFAAEALGVAPHDCVVFEDAPAGIAAGKSAGMRVVGVTSSFSAAELGTQWALSNYEGLTVRL